MISAQLDFPFDEVVREGATLIKRGATVVQKWTCERCRSRLTMTQPNLFYRRGTCDGCGHCTRIDARGCNYMVVVQRAG